jgi:hypothetical protein
MPKRSPACNVPPCLMSLRMRRATSPAICTTASSRPSVSRSRSALRSFSSLALSSDALKNLPGR